MYTSKLLSRTKTYHRVSHKVISDRARKPISVTSQISSRGIVREASSCPFHGLTLVYVVLQSSPTGSSALRFTNLLSRLLDQVDIPVCFAITRLTTRLTARSIEKTRVHLVSTRSRVVRSSLFCAPCLLAVPSSSPTHTNTTRHCSTGRRRSFATQRKIPSCKTARIPRAKW